MTMKILENGIPITNKPKVIGIVGTRSRDTHEDFLLCETEFLKHYQKGDIICSGGCKQGGDRFAEMLIEKYGTEKIIHYAEWKKFGKSAGPIRNTLIANDSDIIIAVVSKERKGGTEDTIRKAKKHDKEVIII